MIRNDTILNLILLTVQVKEQKLSAQSGDASILNADVIRSEYRLAQLPQMTMQQREILSESTVSTLAIIINMINTCLCINNTKMIFFPYVCTYLKKIQSAGFRNNILPHCVDSFSSNISVHHKCSLRSRDALPRTTPTRATKSGAIPTSRSTGLRPLRRREGGTSESSARPSTTCPTAR